MSQGLDSILEGIHRKPNTALLIQFQRLRIPGVSYMPLMPRPSNNLAGWWFTFDRDQELTSYVNRAYRDDCEALAAALVELPVTATKADVIRALDESGLRVVGHGLWDSSLEEFEQ